MHHPAVGTTAVYQELPALGVGVALRSEIQSEIVASSAVIDWLELITEDFLFNPQRREVADAVARKAQRIQNWVEVPFLLENVSTYIDVGGDLTEAEFVTQVMDRCECGLLLDLTNVYNNAVNLGGDPISFVDAIPLDRVVQIHVAGGTWSGGFLQDNHSADVFAEVWDLLAYVLPRAPVKGVLIERDGTPG